MAKEFDANELVRYTPPPTSGGKLQVDKDGSFYTFPIEEESAEGLARELRKSLRDAHEDGYKAGTKSTEKPRVQPTEGRLQRVCVENNRLMVASICRSIMVPQTVNLSKEDLNLLLLRDQINIMIEDAEERGREEGYQERKDEEERELITPDW